MFGTYGANAYQSVGIETGVAAADRHTLIVMLFDGALTAISNALTHLKNGEVAAKGQSISKAIAIIEEGLRASLDLSEGGEIAHNLDALYEFIENQLLQANIRNDRQLLESSHQLLTDLRAAWDGIGHSPAQNGASAPSLPPSNSSYASA